MGPGSKDKFQGPDSRYNVFGSTKLCKTRLENFLERQQQNNSFLNVVNFVSVLQEKGFESVHHYLEYLKSGKKQTTKSKDSEEEEEEEEEEE